MSAESYTVAEAAKVLQRSPKRVRQMIAEGKLSPLPDVEPVSIAAQAVHDMRDALRAGGTRRGPRPEPVTGLTFDQVRELVEELTRPALRALEATQETAQAVEAALRDELAAERAERARLQAEADALRAELEAAQAAPAEPVRRSWWRKG